MKFINFKVLCDQILQNAFKFLVSVTKNYFFTSGDFYEQTTIGCQWDKTWNN